MGEVELFLDGLDRAEALRLAAGAHASAWRDLPGIEPDARRAGVGMPVPQPSRETTPSGQDRAPSSEAENAERRFETRNPAPTLAEPVQRAAALPVLPDGYEAVRELALACTRCRLAEGRTQVVFSDGPPNARVMVVGEAPGANEDETGRPFVGAAGKYLDLLLATVGLSREESVYICNVLKCRPPGNRNPLPDEIDACAPYLRKQIELVAPEAILAVGSFAGQLLTGREKSALGRLRGDVHAFQGVPLVVTYHPAALLRNAGWTRAFWDDLQLLRSVIDR